MYTAQMLALAILLGSIPFGYIAVRLRSPGAARDNPDGRGHSCPRPDLDTIRRAVGLLGLVLVIALNVAKGFVPVLLTRHIVDNPIIAVLAGVLAVLSHCFPYWLMFKPSGKGGSVALGALLALLIERIVE